MSHFNRYSTTADKDLTEVLKRYIDYVDLGFWRGAATVAVRLCDPASGTLICSMKPCRWREREFNEASADWEIVFRWHPDGFIWEKTGNTVKVLISWQNVYHPGGQCPRPMSNEDLLHMIGIPVSEYLRRAHALEWRPNGSSVFTPEKAAYVTRLLKADHLRRPSVKCWSSDQHWYICRACLANEALMTPSVRAGRIVYRDRMNKAIDRAWSERWGQRSYTTGNFGEFKQWWAARWTHLYWEEYGRYHSSDDVAGMGG